MVPTVHSSGVTRILPAPMEMATAGFFVRITSDIGAVQRGNYTMLYPERIRNGPLWLKEDYIIQMLYRCYTILFWLIVFFLPVWGLLNLIEDSGIFCPRIPGRMGYGMLWVGVSLKYAARQNEPDTVSTKSRLTTRDVSWIQAEAFQGTFTKCQSQLYPNISQFDPSMRMFPHGTAPPGYPHGTRDGWRTPQAPTHRIWSSRNLRSNGCGFF